jgi:hypothetical protein
MSGVWASAKWHSLRHSQASVECALTLPSSGRLPAGFARFQPPLMSNVRRHKITVRPSRASQLPCANHEPPTRISSGFSNAGHGTCAVCGLGGGNHGSSVHLGRVGKHGACSLWWPPGASIRTNVPGVLALRFRRSAWRHSRMVVLRTSRSGPVCGHIRPGSSRSGSAVKE